MSIDTAQPKVEDVQREAARIQKEQEGKSPREQAGKSPRMQEEQQQVTQTNGNGPVQEPITQSVSTNETPQKEQVLSPTELPTPISPDLPQQLQATTSSESLASQTPPTQQDNPTKAENPKTSPLTPRRGSRPSEGVNGQSSAQADAPLQTPRRGSRPTRSGAHEEHMIPLQTPRRGSRPQHEGSKTLRTPRTPRGSVSTQEENIQMRYSISLGNVTHRQLLDELRNAPPPPREPTVEAAPGPQQELQQPETAAPSQSEPRPTEDQPKAEHEASTLPKSPSVSEVLPPPSQPQQESLPKPQSESGHQTPSEQTPQPNGQAEAHSPPPPQPQPSAAEQQSKSPTEPHPQTPPQPQPEPETPSQQPQVMFTQIYSSLCRNQKCPT